MTHLGTLCIYDWAISQQIRDDGANLIACTYNIIEMLDTKQIMID